MSIFHRVPWALRQPVRRTRNAIAFARLDARQRRRWREIAATPPRVGAAAVSYGVESIPTTDGIVYGGAVKFQALAAAFPNAPRDFNVLYLGSSSMPLESQRLVALARRRSAAFVWNQNGVAYRGWYGDGWELVNRPRSRLLHEADHVVFQSAFCKLASDRFYGARVGTWEILHNPVDTTRFAPATERRNGPLIMLLGGNQYQRYRVERALETLALVRREKKEARLIVTGDISFAVDGAAQIATIARKLGVDGAFELTGAYSQADAPNVMQRADILLHPKYNDPCPTIVLEAMACGLPVVYSASGGTPELVGDDAGIGVAAPVDWERDHPPASDDLAAAVLRLTDDLSARTAAARERARTFDAQSWIARHRLIFEGLLA